MQLFRACYSRLLHENHVRKVYHLCTMEITHLNEAWQMQVEDRTRFISYVKIRPYQKKRICFVDEYVFTLNQKKIRCNKQTFPDLKIMELNCLWKSLLVDRQVLNSYTKSELKKLVQTFAWFLRYLGFRYFQEVSR